MKIQKKYWHTIMKNYHFARACRYCEAWWDEPGDIGEDEPIGAALEGPHQNEIHQHDCPVGGVTKESR